MGAFLAFLIQGLPFVGRLTDGFFTYVNKKTDADLEKYKVKGVVDVEALKQDTEIIKARTDLAIVMKDDPATKIGRWFFIVPTGLFYCGVIWDSTGILRNWHTLGMLELPGWMQYMPHAVVAYLLVTAWKK